MVESLLFIGAWAGVETGAGEKEIRSRSKTDRLRNTNVKNVLCKDFQCRSSTPVGKSRQLNSAAMATESPAVQVQNVGYKKVPVLIF